MSDKSEQLFKAVMAGDADASLKLLEDAGGACQARDLASQAKEHMPEYFETVGYSIALDQRSGTETLTLYHLSNNLVQPVTSIAQARCEKK